MAVTPQTNTTLGEIAQALLEHDNYVICGHVSPDGDCLGSQLALMWALKAAGKTVEVLLAKDEPIDHTLLFLPGAHRLKPAADFRQPCESFIAVDVPTPDRLGDAASLHAQASFTVTIDHHAVPQAMSQLSYTDPDAASTTMLIWELIDQMGVKRDPLMAICAYTGLMTDTGRFQFQNTDAAAFLAAASMVEAGASPSVTATEIFQNKSQATLELESRAVQHMMRSDDGKVALSWVSLADFEACHAVKADAEPLIDMLRSLQGVEIACILREQTDCVRGSLRAKYDANVKEIAEEFNGGGHTAAAGFTLYEPLPEALAAVGARLGLAKALAGDQEV